MHFEKNTWNLFCATASCCAQYLQAACDKLQYVAEYSGPSLQMLPLHKPVIPTQVHSKTRSNHFVNFRTRVSNDKKNIYINSNRIARTLDESIFIEKERCGAGSTMP